MQFQEVPHGRSNGSRTDDPAGRFQARTPWRTRDTRPCCRETFRWFNQLPRRSCRARPRCIHYRHRRPGLEEVQVDRGRRSHGQVDHRRRQEGRGQSDTGSEGRGAQAEGQGREDRDQAGSRHHASCRARSRARSQIHPGSCDREGRCGPRGLPGQIRPVPTSRSGVRGTRRCRVQHDLARARCAEARGCQNIRSFEKVLLPEVRGDCASARKPDSARGNGGNREGVR